VWYVRRLKKEGSTLFHSDPAMVTSLTSSRDMKTLRKKNNPRLQNAVWTHTVKRNHGFQAIPRIY
jgi:chromatin remodeling complex protein RSC6